MVSLVNGSLCNENGNKSPMENGHIIPVKYKPRKVSAVRDFPPGCGRNVPIINMNPLETTVELVVADKAEDVVAVHGAKTLEIDMKSESDVLRINVSPPETTESLVVANKIEGNIEAEKEVLVKTELTKGETWTLEKGQLCDGDVQALVIKTESREAEAQHFAKEELQRRVSATRDFPPFCGRNAPPLTDEDRFRINSGNLVEKVGNEIVVFSQEESISRKMSMDEVELGGGLNRIIVQGLMAAASDLLKQEGALTSPDYGMSRSKAKKRDFTGQEKSKLGSKKKTTDKSFSSRESKKKLLSAQKAGNGDILDLVIKDEEDYVAHDEDKTEASPAGQGSREFEVTLPPFGPNSSSHGDARNRVRESLRLFQAICRKILQGEESKSRLGEQTKSRQKDIKRIDLSAAKIIKEKGKEVNTDKQILGAVPGVEVGDEFQYRVELAIVGIHRLYQAGIDYMKYRGEIVAASIVASGGYADELDNADVLIYSGQGGIVGKNKDKQPEDQKLKRGNLALKNSISAKNSVRVIRGSKETKASDSVDARGKGVMTYVYDGLYTVDRYWQEVGPLGKLVFKFELRRIPGQPELAWKEVKKSKKSKTREGLCVDDISGGKEVIPICAVNTIDDEKPPPFSYITKMIYPDHCLPFPPKGCDCKSGCLDGRTCLCAAKNGEIPYNFNGAIVEMKPLVYECSPLCKCPPSCCNRVSQHGIRFQLEIFKTESRGWGVRSLNSISAGSFICEYTGELLEDTEAEKRTGNDEYLFDIGQNYNDCSLKPDEEASSSKIVEDGGFTIDAAQCGNVGRFINHSCSPNLYAQNVLYDHEDKRMPHIMFFAAENIPPLQELTYHYNYAVDQIHDSNGNIKMKRCYCGSAECTGRMY